MQKHQVVEDLTRQNGQANLTWNVNKDLPYIPPAKGDTHLSYSRIYSLKISWVHMAAGHVDRYCITGKHLAFQK